MVYKKSRSFFLLITLVFVLFANVYSVKILFPRAGQALTEETCFIFQFTEKKALKLFKTTKKFSLSRYDRKAKKSIRVLYTNNENNIDYKFITKDIVETIKPINLKNFPFCTLFIVFNSVVDEYLSDDKDKMFGPLTKKLGWIRKEMNRTRFHKFKYLINNKSLIKQIGKKYFMHYAIETSILFFDGDLSKKKKKVVHIDYNQVKIVHSNSNTEWNEKLQTISPNNVSRIFSSTPFFEWKWENPAGKYLIFEVGDYEKSRHGFFTVYKKKFKQRSERLSIFKFKLPSGIIKLGKQYKWRISTVRDDGTAIHTEGPRVFETVKW